MPLIIPQSFKKQHKYGAKMVTVDGITFSSKKEANRYQYLKRLEQVGFIKNLRRQVVYPLAKVINGKDYIVKTPCGYCMRYYADFAYYDVQRKKEIVEDVKGMDTPVSEIKRAIVKMFYDIDIEII